MDENGEQETFQQCPDCDASYDVSGFKEGKNFECQLCGSVVVVGQSQPPSDVTPSPSSKSPNQSSQNDPSTPESEPSGQVTSNPSGMQELSNSSSPPQTGSSQTNSPRGRGGGGGQNSRKNRSYKKKRSSGKNSDLPILLGLMAILAIALVIVLNMNGDQKSTPNQPQQDHNSGRDKPVQNQSSSDNKEPPSDSKSSSDGNQTNQSGSSVDKKEKQRSPGRKTDQNKSGSSRSPDSSSALPPQRSSKKETGSSTSRKRKKTSSSTNKEWNVDRDLMNKFLEAFKNSQSMASSEKETKREKFRNKYAARKLIPAVIQAIFETDSEWVAEQANMLLKEMTNWSRAPHTMKGLGSNKKINKNAKNWKQYWLKVDWKKKKKELRQQKARKKKMDEIKPLCVKAANALPTENEGTRKVRQKGEAYLPILIDLLKSKNTDREVAEGANIILQNLTGQDFGELPSGDRSELIRKWEEWWKNNQDNFSYD